MAEAGVLDTLKLVVQHLTSRRQGHLVQQHNQQQPKQPWDLPTAGSTTPRGLGSAAVRALHPVSRSCCNIVRATRSCARLDSYLDTVRVKLRNVASFDPLWVPWGFLAAAPAVSTIYMCLDQAPALEAGPQDTLHALAGRLKSVHVVEAASDTSSSSGGAASSSSRSIYKFDSLGTFLAHCRGLQALSLSMPEAARFAQSWSAPWLTSLGSLQVLRMECRPAQDKLELPDELPALRGSLRELSVSWLGWGPAPGAVLAPLTNLRRLDLVAMGGAEQPLDWLTSFPHLTHLNLSQSWVAPLPEDLGQVLPSLEVLLVAVCGLSSIPPGLTRLTRLDVSDNPELQVEGVAAVAEATSLRELDLSECHLRHLEGLSTLERLEVLVVRGAFYEPSYSDAEELGYLPEPDFYGPYAEEMGLDADEPPTLPHLVNLRHLDLSRSYWRVSTMLTMGGLQRLTRLDLAYALKHEDGYGNAGNLPALGALPDLTELNLERVLIDSSEWPAVGAWLGQQSQLTRLCVSSNKEMIAPPGNPEHLQQYAEGFAQLPTQLVELDLRSSNLQVWPPRLSQMTDLKVLLLGDGNQWLPGELPSWLPALQQLEVLEVEQVGPLGIKQAADLLLQLPRLREFEATQSGKLMWRMEMLLPKLERLPRMDLSPPSPLRSAPAHLLYELLGQVSRLSDRYCHPRGLFS